MFKSQGKRESISVRVSDIQYEMPVDPNAPAQPQPELLGVEFDTIRQVLTFVIANGANASFHAEAASPVAPTPGKLKLEYK